MTDKAVWVIIVSWRIAVRFLQYRLKRADTMRLWGWFQSAQALESKPPNKSKRRRPIDGSFVHARYGSKCGLSMKSATAQTLRGPRYQPESSCLRFLQIQQSAPEFHLPELAQNYWRQKPQLHLAIPEKTERAKKSRTWPQTAVPLKEVWRMKDIQSGRLSYPP